MIFAYLNLRLRLPSPSSWLYAFPNETFYIFFSSVYIFFSSVLPRYSLSAVHLMVVFLLLWISQCIACVHNSLRCLSPFMTPFMSTTWLEDTTRQHTSQAWNRSNILDLHWTLAPLFDQVTRTFTIAYVWTNATDQKGTPKHIPAGCCKCMRGLFPAFCTNGLVIVTACTNRYTPAYMLHT